MSSCGMLENLRWNKLPLWCVFKKMYGLFHTYMVMSMHQRLVTRESTQKAGQCVPSTFSLLVADTYVICLLQDSQSTSPKGPPLLCLPKLSYLKYKYSLKLESGQNLTTKSHTFFNLIYLFNLGKWKHWTHLNRVHNINGLVIFGHHL